MYKGRATQIPSMRYCDAINHNRISLMPRAGVALCYGRRLQYRSIVIADCDVVIAITIDCDLISSDSNYRLRFPCSLTVQNSDRPHFRHFFIFLGPDSVIRLFKWSSFCASFDLLGNFEDLEGFYDPFSRDSASFSKGYRQLHFMINSAS